VHMQSEDEKDYTIEDLMNNVVHDDEDKQKFRLVEKRQSQLYVFERKEVHKVYCVLTNYVIR